jgi:restriction system protein
MKLRMHENSLFAILLRSRWWISFAVGFGLYGAVRLFLPEAYAAVAVMIPVPFVVIGCVAAWRQLRAPSAARVAERLDALRAMSWAEFSAALESVYRREGYEVRRLDHGAADLELARAGQRTLVGAKRWKAARVGAEALRALAEASRGDAAVERVYLAAGEVSEQARAFAAANAIRIVDGAALAALLARAKRD